ncbi:hypothetical protein KY290_022185 [Solanum tuberosum]|uniref:Uncharacterized protein n=1 Tax=Solanum tuberosum TaxID=4113 RepID=A0ABQ7V5P7_SOLTU|nr:hypothetical protein KY289_021314 [Solanum tuberosum]KAH0758692.1 hypothetical protein KY290_022185 [Solanum tuberosum]
MLVRCAGCWRKKAGVELWSSPERFSRCCLLGLGGFDFTGNGEVIGKRAVVQRAVAAALFREEERNKI